MVFNGDAEVERRWLAGLLGREKAVVPLPKYLKATETGGREWAREAGVGVGKEERPR